VISVNAQAVFKTKAKSNLPANTSDGSGQPVTLCGPFQILRRTMSNFQAIPQSPQSHRISQLSGALVFGDGSAQISRTNHSHFDGSSIVDLGLSVILISGKFLKLSCNNQINRNTNAMR
jgi:hypothetical protein